MKRLHRAILIAAIVIILAAIIYPFAMRDSLRFSPVYPIKIPPQPSNPQEPSGGPSPVFYYVDPLCANICISSLDICNDNCYGKEELLPGGNGCFDDCTSDWESCHEGCVFMLV